MKCWWQSHNPGELIQYRITGLGFTPQAIWLDHNGNTAASVSSWFSVIPAPYQNAIPQLQEAQQAADDVWSGRAARERSCAGVYVSATIR
jgi:hypothetical protein